MRTSHLLLLIIFSVARLTLHAQSSQHPRLILTKEGVTQIKAQLGKVPLFDKTLKSIQSKTDKALKQPINVPVPVDAGGGYTHEQHKRNYNSMYNAGVLYQLTEDAKYAEYVRTMLLEYAKLYPTLPLHPIQKSNYRGRLFWQGLNECVWLVNTAQAYDCIYTYLKPKDRRVIEENLFKPMVKFIAIDNQSTFERIHNHGTWAVAGVGMISYVMGDYDMVEKSLYGLDKSGKGGFMRQIDQLFSPDGYFEEGPYYQRYSIQPFLTFAQVIDNNEPQRAIFKYKNGALLKAVTTLLQLTESNGQFLHFNDALNKTWHSNELVWGVDIAYNKTGDRQLLSIAKEQNTVILSEAGCRVARDIALAEPFIHRTMVVRDGPDGDKGGIGILRSDNNPNGVATAMKYTSHGMAHGHFDKLTITYYDNGKEIIQDYGAARFLNIEPKDGGRYLKENETFAKQTIAHNTLTVDGKSHFGGKMKVSSNYAPSFYAFANTENVKMISAKESHAAPGVNMQRTLFLINHPAFTQPVVVDILKATSSLPHQYDLPYYYKGQLIHTTYPYEAFTTGRSLLGIENGYQHLWVEAKGKSDVPTTTTTWLNDNRFYSISTLTNENTEIYLNRIGGTDPNFNLRNDPSVMFRQKNTDNQTFVSVIEAHGDYNPQLEYTIDPYSAVGNIRLGTDTEDYTIVEIKTKSGKTLTVCLANTNSDPKAKHVVGSHRWTGVYAIY